MLKRKTHRKIKENNNKKVKPRKGEFELVADKIRSLQTFRVDKNEPLSPTVPAYLKLSADHLMD